MKYVLDTNIFNRVADGRFDLASISDACGFVATMVQLRELENTKNPVRRAALLQVFNETSLILSAAAFSFDIPGAGFDEGEWSSDERIKRMRDELESIDPKPNNWHDALIASAALKCGYGLVTSDEPLATVAMRYGIKVCHVTS